ncbi:MAG: hypothetical protein H7256_10935 [Bdellovibrio sp.]|nr:hypothetical protein [Bdellovibrio sp.]
MQKNLIFALHGFLGQSKDWQAVQTHMPKNIAWLAPNLFSKDSLDLASYYVYVDHLMTEYSAALKPFQRKIFVGYSLGGRLGLHLLKKYSNHFDQFVFVSTHPGLQSPVEKSERKKSDRAWTDKIQNQTWSQFITEWNSQPVFSKNDPEPERDETNFDRGKLALAMDLWSLAEQDDLRSLIHANNRKITWVVGDQDSKFLNLASDLEQKKILLGFNKISSGHRILVSNSKDLAQLLQNWF